MRRRPGGGRRRAAGAPEDAARVLRAAGVPRPDAAVVLGSGLASFAEGLTDRSELAYEDIPGLPCPAVPGHGGSLFHGNLGGRRVIVLSGRAHLYEGHAPSDVVFAVRLLAALGTPVLVLTNASGGIDPSFEVGDLMAIADQISLASGRWGLSGMPPFTMGGVYAPRLRALARQAARDAGLALREGVYLGSIGPTYETPAEIRAARLMGAHAVGMSTVLEVQAARAAGMEVLGLSLISNAPLPGRSDVTTHEEVLAVARGGVVNLLLVVSGVLERL